MKRNENVHKKKYIVSRVCATWSASCCSHSWNWKEGIGYSTQQHRTQPLCDLQTQEGGQRSSFMHRVYILREQEKLKFEESVHIFEVVVN